MPGAVIRDAAQPAFDSPDSESDITIPGRLGRLVPVEAAAGYAIIGNPVTIADVEGVRRGGEALAEFLPTGGIE